MVIFALGVNATLALLEEAEAAAKNDDDRNKNEADVGGKNDNAGEGGEGDGRKDSVSEPLLSQRQKAT